MSSQWQENPFQYNVHLLKCETIYFNEIARSRKKFEWRKNDRNFCVGDFLVLRDYDKEKDKYSGRIILCRVPWAISGRHNITSGYVIMYLDILNNIPFEDDQAN